MSVRIARRGAIAAARASAPAANVAYLSLPGTSGNYASTPDSAAVSAGTFDMRVRLSLPNWSGTYSFASKYGAAGQISWRFRTFVKFLASVRSADGTATTSNNAGGQMSVSDGNIRWVRMTFDSGFLQFMTSTDGTNWNVEYASSVGGSIFDSTAPLVVGAGNLDGTVEPIAANIYYAELRNGVGGTVVAKFDPTTVTKTATRTPNTVTASTGEIWTVNGSGWDWVLV